MAVDPLDHIGYPSDMVEVIDARGVTVTLPHPPQRIVSLVPSTTETLFALGLGSRVVGITRYCVHPAPELGGIVKVGGTKRIEADRLRALKPDLIVGNIEENTREIFELCESICPLYTAFPQTVDDALTDLLKVGSLTSTDEQAASHHRAIREAREAVTPEPFTYAYLIWRGPYMGLNSSTFIAALLAEVGGRNVFATREPRYFELTPEELRAAEPDVILLSSEPFPFKDRHLQELVSETGLPAERFALVDGELCSWHGVRMADGLRYLDSAPWRRR